LDRLLSLFIYSTIFYSLLQAQKSTQKYLYPYFAHGIYANFEGEDNHFLNEALHIFTATIQSRLLDTYYAYPHQIESWISSNISPITSKKPRITWIGHATFLLQIGGVNIITDPLFFDLSLLYQRTCTTDTHKIPPIDVVLISHSHLDHYDKPSIELVIKNAPLFLLPQQTMHPEFLINKPSIIKSTCQELTWWQTYTFNKNYTTTTFTFLPARHWSNRSLTDINTSLWGSWMIECNGYTIYFAGDSAYDEHFKLIAQHFPTINYALMPIAPNEPNKFTKSTHMNAQEAVQAFIDLHAQYFIPMHWGTYKLGTDSFLEPITRLQTSWKNRATELFDKSIILPKFGQVIDLEKTH
jgi:L-ascorbate metabolism protein UlaG (beta-lactamase superfamily)